MSSPVPSTRDSLASADLHRLDQAAWLLAHKDPTPDPDAVLAVAGAAAAAAERSGRTDLVIALIAAMIERPPAGSSARGQAREDCAARRYAGVLAVLDGTPEAALLQQSLRRGGLSGNLPLPTARRLRRAIKRSLREPPVADAEIEALRGLAATAWESLLDALARSLALDGDDEILTDVALDGPGGERAPARLARVRALLRRVPDDARATAGAVGPREPAALGRRLGRFVLLQRIGSGAMGVVYAAYDDKLDRKIAIKVLRQQSTRDSARAQLRLLREAQAMARLSHPNVAVVHEVGTDGDDVYVAMEFIRGTTVQTWLSSQPRSWRDIVDVFLQAGKGLAAAHAAGLVHRDFKPSNVMIGVDGRVRVLDFGLCSTGRDSESGEHERPHRDLSGEITAAAPKVTQGGEVVGTPAYMPPEQFSGRFVGPASDQFAFCVSLHEALYGQLPFPGDTVQELAHAVARGEVRDPPRGTRVPAWLHAVVLRGLRPDPRDRYPGMDALLKALDRSHALRRRTYAAALGLAGVAAAFGFIAAKAQHAQAGPCSGGDAAIDAAWGGERRAAAERAFSAAGPAFVAEVWPRVQGHLDGYRRDWVAEHRDACLAHQRGELSDGFLDRRMACLDQRKTALAEVAQLLAERDPNVALRALELVDNLPSIARCSDLSALERDQRPLPDDPVVARRIQAMDDEIQRLENLEKIGRQAAATELADQLVDEAEALGEPSARARALLARGRLALSLLADDPTANAELLRGALSAAVEAGDDERAAEATTLLMFVRGREPGQATSALEFFDLARAFLSRVSSPGPLRGLLLNNAAVVAFAGGDAERARQLHAEALRVKQVTHGPNSIEVAYTLTNLAMLHDDPDARARQMQEALPIFEEQRGSAHPQTIEARLAASLNVRDPEAARQLLRPGCEALERFAAPDLMQRARCLYYLAHHAREAGAEDDARQAQRRAAELIADEATDAGGPLNLDGTLIRGYAALDTGGSADAVRDLRNAIEASPRDQWFQRRARAECELLLGLHLQAAGELEGAEQALQAAIDDFAAVAAEARDVLRDQRLARARVALVQVSLAGQPSARTLERAGQLLADAERWYRDGGDAYAWRLAEVRQLERRILDLRRQPRISP